MMPRCSLSFLALALVLGLAVRAGAQGQHVLQNAKDATWSDAPPFLPAGAKIDVVRGDPGGSALYTVRLQFPASYRIPAHSHPTDEHVVVESGTLYLGMGEKLDARAGTPLAVGGIAVMPAGMNHYAYTREPVRIVLYGLGPVEFRYVNPADDPRNAAKK